MSIHVQNCAELQLRNRNGKFVRPKYYVGMKRENKSDDGFNSIKSTFKCYSLSIFFFFLISNANCQRSHWVFLYEKFPARELHSHQAVDAGVYFMHFGRGRWLCGLENFPLNNAIIIQDGNAYEYEKCKKSAKP